MANDNSTNNGVMLVGGRVYLSLYIAVLKDIKFLLQKYLFIFVKFLTYMLLWTKASTK